jgi:hypothetical protein
MAGRQVLPFATKAITTINKLVAANKVSPTEKISLLTHLLVAIPKAKHRETAEKDFGSKLIEIEKRSPVEVITPEDLNAMFEVQSGTVNGSFIVTIVLMLAAAITIVYYHVTQGIDYTINATALTAIVTWLFRTWRDHAIKKIAAILQQRAIDAASGGSSTETKVVRFPLLGKIDDFVLRVYGFGDSVSRLINIPDPSNLV